MMFRKQRRLAAAGLTKYQRLHDAGCVGPFPRLAMNVVTQDDGVLLPGLLHQFAFSARRDRRQLVRPCFLTRPSCACELVNAEECGNGSEQQPQCEFEDLLIGDVPGVFRDDNQKA